MSSLLRESEVVLPQLVVLSLVEGKDSWGARLELGRDDRFSAIDEEEMSLPSWLHSRGAD
jgi:hypothetical protein